MTDHPETGPNRKTSFERRTFLLLLAAFFVLSFPKLLLGVSTLFFRDFAVISYPVIAYHHDSFWRGEFPLWTPLSHCGAPMLAQWGTMSLYPASLIYLVFPLPWSLSIFWMAHLYLGGAGMFSLAKEHGANSFGSALAGVVFIFNGLVMSSLVWPNYSVALGWMPWVILFVERTWSRGGRASIWAVLAGSMQMLSGVPEIIMATWVLLGALLTYKLCQPETPRWVVLQRHLLLVLWVAALCAAQLLPFMDLISRSQRDQNFGTSGWSMASWGWASLLTPLLNCAQSPQGVFYQPRHIFITSYYLGIGWFSMALLGVLTGRNRRNCILGAAALFTMIIALGDDGYLYPLLKTIFPPLGFARYPIKAFYLAAFCLTLLAASGVTSLMETRERERELRLRFGGILVALGLGVGATIVYQNQHPPSPALGPVEVWNSILRLVVLVVSGGLMLWIQKSVAPREAKGVQFVLISLLWLDAMTYAPNLVPTLPADTLLPSPPAASVRTVLGTSRAMVSAYAEKRLYASRVKDFQADVEGKHLALWANLNLIDRVPKVDGGLTLQIREEAEVETEIRVEPTNDYPRLLDFLGVSQITAPEKVVDWAERPSAQPIVTIGEHPVFLASDKTLAAILSPSFDPAHEVFLEMEAQGTVGSLPAESDAVAKIVAFAANRMEIEVNSARETMVVIAQTYHPNWIARVDETPTRVWRANHAYQAIKIPAGKHRITLAYQDKQFIMGLSISLAAAAILLLQLTRRRAIVP